MSSYRTTETQFGICNDNFHRYFHSRGYIHLYCVVYIHLRLRREYIIETVNNLRKWMLNTKKREEKKKSNNNNNDDDNDNDNKKSTKRHFISFDAWGSSNNQ